MNRPLAYLCLILCVLYGLLLIVAVPLVSVLLGISGFGYSEHFTREWWTTWAMIAYAAMLAVGLPASIGLLRRYLARGPVALREASRWSWWSAAVTLPATILLLAVSLAGLYLPGAAQSPDFGSFAFSLFLYPLGIVFPCLLSLRRGPSRAAA